MILLRITYRLRAHHMPQFEKIFADEIAPLIREHNLKFKSIWRTVVGSVGEYMELWEFDSVADFDERWRALIGDARLQTIFERTGPMVEDEQWSLMEAALPPESDQNAG
ncbi:MAG TPA: NIPSNAP family protein [Blastocatellia bacterium]|nr:NIPSNAP family protein [Blastocatellia bacterium]